MDGVPRDPLAGQPGVMTGDAQRVARLAGGALAVLGSGSLVGVAFSLYLVNHQPLLLVALSPIGRHLILAAPLVDPVAFVAVAVLRRMAFYLACFHLGRALGPAGILWIEARAHHFGRLVRWLERLFGRWGSWLVLLAAGPTVSALAGISGMSARRFTALVVPGLVLRMLLILGVAAWLREPIEAVLAWIDRHWVPGTVLMVAGIAAHQLWRRSQAPAAAPPPAA